MRVVVVSAHFPPNFVSGGTIQPQRLARGLRARGHDVSVFAGWLGDRPPLEEWDQPDETGLPVHWIAVTPFTDWRSRRNYDNPAVARALARYIGSVRPDVVHLHSLQALGGGLVPVAARARAATVVTMHDFWWVCGRQFLADRAMVPCSLVVDAGVCQCEIERTWLERRNRALARELAHADLVLAPSATAVRVLAANGVRPDVLEIDENGLPPLVDGRAERTPDATVRFLYAGGPEPLKGANVLVRACRRLRDTAGWRLDAYGVDPVDDVPQVVAREPFAADEAPAVFAEADVLLLPSIMRESYSLLTREALAAGLPVVCSDSLGPEEAVEEGVNGLVVPTGDDEALAETLRRLIADRPLLDGLRAGVVEPPVRSLEDQLDGLEARYSVLRSAPRQQAATAGGPAAGRPRRVLFVVGINGAPLRYRAQLPAEAIGLAGIRSRVMWYSDPHLARRAAQADAVVVYRAPATPWLLDVIGQARQRGTPVLFDVDDLIFDPDLAGEIPALDLLPSPEAEDWLDGVHRYRTTMEACDLFVASTPALARHAEAVTGLPAERYDNGVGIVLGGLSDGAVRRPRAPGPPRVGYFSGTTTRDNDWAMVEDAVVDVLARHEDAELWLVGHVRPGPVVDALGSRVRRIGFQPWRALPDLLRDVDVNLAPLVPGNRFNEAKSAVKWLEAALVETPTVASPTEPYVNAIEPGMTGLLADDADQWADALDRLLGDDVHRRRVGTAARRAALLRWSPHLQSRRYLEVLARAQTIAAGGVPPRTSSWVPRVVDEPPARHRPDPYHLPPWGRRLTDRLTDRVPERVRRLGAGRWTTYVT